MVALEMQAIILAAGNGSRMTELSGERPKCLLPVGPLPLVWYPLHMLQTHGFQEVIVVVQESQRSEIQQALEKAPLQLKLDFATIPTDSDFGTADSLKHIHEKIKSDVLVVSCDTITNADLFGLINEFRKHDASLAALFLKGGAEADTIIPGPKTKNNPERDLIGIHEETNRLLFLSSASDFEEVVSLNGHLLRKNQAMTIHSRLVDAHVYLIKRWVINFLVQNEGFSTIKGELLPYIIRKQLSRSGPGAIDGDNIFSTTISDEKSDDIFSFMKQTELQTQIRETSLFNDSSAGGAYHADWIRCYASRAPKDVFGIRVNTTLNYCAANKKIFAEWERLFPLVPLIAATSIVRSTQLVECAVGDNATISEKTSLKNSVLGPNCLVKPKTRVSDSVLMNGVVVEEGVVIENCVICERAHIKAGSFLKNCLIGPNFIVEENLKAEKLHLTNADGFMEIE